MPSIVVMPLILSPLIYLSGRWMAATARMITLAALGAISVFFILTTANIGISAQVYRQGMIAFYFDGLSLVITALVLLLATLVTVYSGPDMRGIEGEEKYYAMLLLLTGAVIGLVCAGDLFNLWMWFEMTAISSYLLVAFYRERQDALAACAKYLIQTATGSILVLFGIALLFAQTGTLDLAQMKVPASPFTVVAAALFIIGFGVKVALAPTYTWLPDAYAQAPTGISALLSGIVTITGLVAMLRVLALLNGLELGAVLIGFGTVNIVIGNLLALRQDEVKRIFAYSSISHIGFMLLAVGIGLYTQQPTGFYGGMLHLFNHALMKALAFLAVGVVIYSRQDKTAALHINDLRGLSARDRITSFALVIACLSLGGIPPLAGFMSKLQIFTAGLETGDQTLVLLMTFAAFNSVFSLAYYFPIINALFQPETSPTHHPPPTAMHLPIMLLTAVVIMLGLAPGLVDSLIIPASDVLMRLFGG
jgi:proton-translocating NADH-quinone oxidoreductase chain N